MQQQGPTRAPVLGAAPFRIELSTDAVAGEVRLSGELDLLTAPHLQAVLDELLERGCLNLTLDLSELDFLACAGLTVLSRAGARFRAAGGRITVVSISRPTRRILEITGLEESFLLA